MATKQKEALPPLAVVTVPRSVLEQFIDLVEGLEWADSAYKACQTSLFRSCVQSACRAANLQTAYAQAKEALGVE